VNEKVKQDDRAVCCCRMSHVQAIQWLCDNVNDDCENNVVDDDDNDDVTVADKLSPTPTVTGSSSAPHNANSSVGLLFLIDF